MAIPSWVWSPDRLPSDPRPTSGSMDPAEIERLTGTLAMVSNGTRVEILTSLYDRTEPIPYTELKEATSIEDNGQFNYHLRQLDDLLRCEGGTYELTGRGEAVTRAILETSRYQG